jgi:glutamine synthetase
MPEQRVGSLGPNVRFVCLVMVDYAGITRLKMIPARRLATVAERGVGISSLMGIFTIDDHAAYLPGREGLENPSGDIRMLPDLDAAVELAGGEGLAWAPVDQIHQSGTPTTTCQRTFLRRTQAAAEAAGREFRMAFELEFTLIRREHPLHTWPAFSAAGLYEVEPFAIDLVEACEGQGLQVDQFQAEAGPGQFEIAIAAAEPVAAADRYLLLRHTTRRIAARHGYEVSFSPATSASETLGSGTHIHWSVFRDGRNLFAGGDLEGGITPEGSAAAAGVLDRLYETCAVFAPSVVSYLRLQPGHWAGAFTTWGIDNREAALRLARGLWSAGPTTANFELKPADGAANPYLAAGVIVAAASDGIERGLKLPAPVQADPSTLTDAERERAGARRLPSDLNEATDAIEASEFARAALGDDQHAAFVATRRSEWSTLHQLERDELIRFHELRYG